MGVVGIKETKEVLLGVNELAIVLIKLLKDGVQLDDAMALYAKISSDEAFRGAVLNAVDKIAQVPSEIGELDIAEGIELASLQLSFVPKIADALKA